MVEVKFHPLGKDQGQYLFVVIVTKHKEKWVWVKHCQRDTWEIPGGHIEEGETADYAASRELKEETGAINFKIDAICDYTVNTGNKMGTSRLYFARVSELGPLPESEICCIDFFDEIPEKLTHPDIQPLLFKEVRKHLNEIGIIKETEKGKG